MPIYLLENFHLTTQLDNQLNPQGSCNLTCVKMCLEFLGAKRKRNYGYAQWEDELQYYCEKVLGLDRHSPIAMKQVAESYGVRDELLIVTGWSEVGKALQRTIAHIRLNRPAILHTYLTSSGHIVCADGVELDTNGQPVRFHLVDPYGEFFPDGYDRNYGDDPNLGKYWLSYQTFTKLVLADAQLWVHLLQK